MLSAHCGEERDRRVFAEEFQTFEILGCVTVARREADGDYHVALARGVGFFDFNHNQTGRSRSCIELHPILGIERVG